MFAFAPARAYRQPILETIGIHKSPAVSVFEQYQLNRQKQAYRQQMLEQWMSTAAETGTGRPIDAIIGPVAPHPAALPDGVK